SKLRLLLPSLRHVIPNCWASCRAVLRIAHDTRTHARDPTSVYLGEPSAQGCPAGKGICYAVTSEELDDHRAEAGCRGSAGASSKRRGDGEARRDTNRAVCSASAAGHTGSRGRAGCG